MSIKNRVQRLEKGLGVGSSAQTLEEMIEQFNQGRYGMKPVQLASCYRNSGNCDALLSRLPNELADYLRVALGKAARKAEKNLRKRYPDSY